MPLAFQRISETPDRQFIQDLMQQSLRAMMPRAGAQGFSEEALQTGEVGRILNSMAAMFVDSHWDLKRFGRQLTFTDAQAEYVDELAAGRGLPARDAGEHPDDYVWRILSELLINGVTMPAIQENLTLLGFESELYPMAERLLVPYGHSNREVLNRPGRNRVPSTSRGLLPNARTKAGVYGIDLWGPTNNKAGVIRLLNKLTSAGCAYRLRFHIHWNGADTVNLHFSPNLGRKRRKFLPVFNLTALTPGSRQTGTPSRAGWPLGGKKQTYGVARRHRKGILVPEAGILAYLPVAVDGPNLYLEIDWIALNGFNLSYNQVEDPLRVDSLVTSLQAGCVRSKQPVSRLI